MNEITDLWKNYNTSSKQLKEKLGRTSNLVGEYAEYLVNEYLNGELLTASHASADIKAPNGDLHQVKSRKITNGQTTQLGIIRSWNFDFLTIILFDDNGSVIKGLIYPKSIAEKYAVENEHQNGWVISITNEFLNDENKLDITQKIRQINNDSQVHPKNETSTNLNFGTETFKKENRNTNTPFQEKSELKIGKYVQKTFNEIINKIDRNELENLQRQDYSKTVFDLQFPFLRKVQKNDKEKPLRYWKTPVRIMGELYFMCSEWYEKEPNNDRPYYENWLNKMRKK
ncbi:MAG: hypothetical protein JXL97_07030 [Bacteroidales bacterium]|nr:hypothetical protein [Bacteroidales bacterium]